MDIQNIELHQLMDKDRLLFNLSDTLDMKASVSLILITFLATQTAELFRIEQLPVLLHWLQFLSALGLFAATISAIVVLWSRKWSVEKSEKFPEWRAKLQEHFRDQDDADQKVADQYLAARGRSTFSELRRYAPVAAAMATLTPTFGAERPQSV